jgi:hypothetical protein
MTNSTPSEEARKLCSYDEDTHNNRFKEGCPVCKAIASKLSEYQGEIERLKGERCYICRPDDPLASEEGCSDCDAKSDLHQAIDSFQAERGVLAEALKDAVACMGGINSDKVCESVRVALDALKKVE